MTAHEIREIRIYGGDAGTSEIAEMLREIAAQLAELNATLSDATDSSAGDFPGVIRVRSVE
jgi:hypothetical protein